jgi:hypothetical protein
MDPTAGPDDMQKGKLLTLPDSNSDPSVVQPVARRHTDYAIPAPGKELSNCSNIGRAIAQAVSRRLPTAACFNVDGLNIML